MVAPILGIILIVVILGSLGMGVVIIYHFKLLGMKEDPNVRKILRIFEIGGLIIIAINIILFLFIIIKTF